MSEQRTIAETVGVQIGSRERIRHPGNTVDLFNLKVASSDKHPITRPHVTSWGPNSQIYKPMKSF